jgi:hypothetical protein
VDLSYEYEGGAGAAAEIVNENDICGNDQTATTQQSQNPRTRIRECTSCTTQEQLTVRTVCLIRHCTGFVFSDCASALCSLCPPYSLRSPSVSPYLCPSSSSAPSCCPPPTPHGCRANYHRQIAGGAADSRPSHARDSNQPASLSISARWWI